jgi:MazG family protein
MSKKTTTTGAGRAFEEFVGTISQLRDPQSGCPWDLKQTHLTLRKYMLEEAYEAVEAMSEGTPKEIAGELGDVLLQVVLNSQLGKDAGQFDIEEVVRGVDAKMRRRHPHVFGDLVGKNVSVDDVKRRWQEIKLDEKGETKPKGAFDGLKSESFPASTFAYKIGKQSKEVEFDWDGPNEVFEQFRSEVDELEVELTKPKKDKAAIEAELGDLFFTLAQLTRHLSLDPETVAAQGNQKFLRRYTMLETIAHERGINLTEAGTETKEELWKEAKKRGV